MGLLLFFLPNFLGATFIQGGTFIPDSGVPHLNMLLHEQLCEKLVPLEKRFFLQVANSYLDLDHSTDKRTDVWSRDFMIWKINFGLWAVAWAGLWDKRVWAEYEQLLMPVFSLFWVKKFFFNFF